jgi:hypothetical protein
LNELGRVNYLASIVSKIVAQLLTLHVKAFLDAFCDVAGRFSGILIDFVDSALSVLDVLDVV